jgi:hypothetical protein
VAGIVAGGRSLPWPGLFDGVGVVYREAMRFRSCVVSGRLPHTGRTRHAPTCRGARGLYEPISMAVP